MVRDCLWGLESWSWISKPTKERKKDRKKDIDGDARQTDTERYAAS